MKNNVNHPSHYNSHPSGIECIDIARYYCFAIGNAIKYLWRCGLKQEQGMSDIDKEIEDMNKAIWYIRDRIVDINPHKYLYPKNEHIYTVLDVVRSKNSSNGEWEDHVVYTDGKGTYTRESTDFYSKFVLLDTKADA